MILFIIQSHIFDVYFELAKVFVKIRNENVLSIEMCIY